MAPAWLWLDARAASMVEDSSVSPAYAAHYRADRLRPQCLPAEPAAGLAQAPPARDPVARGDGVPLQGLALFPAHRRARHRSLGGELHLRRFPHPRATTRHPRRARHAADRRRLLAADRRRHAAAHPLTPEAAARETGLAAGHAGRARLCRRGLHRAWRRASTTATRGVGCIDHRLDRHAHAACARRRRGAASTPSAPATPWLSGARARTRRCSRTWRRPSTSTGCSTSRATCWRLQGIDAFARPDLLAGSTTRCCRAQPGRAALPSLYFRGRRARALSSIPTPARSSSASQHGIGYCRSDARRLSRASPSPRAIATPRWARCRGEVRLDRRRRALAGAEARSFAAPRHAMSRRSARGGRRSRRGDDRCRRARPLSRI